MDIDRIYIELHDCLGDPIALAEAVYKWNNYFIENHRDIPENELDKLGAALKEYSDIAIEGLKKLNPNNQ